MSADIIKNDILMIDTKDIGSLSPKRLNLQVGEPAQAQSFSSINYGDDSPQRLETRGKYNHDGNKLTNDIIFASYE